ncbi:hypothetical protein BZA70DRAFT_264963 [Myxozyma melibiosi]|uniref:Uncharacterized protein n=1 Tax=Myxozyma melibiosi TaxID=54550 RepID=A0ABR1FCN0_9ASCO
MKAASQPVSYWLTSPKTAVPHEKALTALSILSPSSRADKPKLAHWLGEGELNGLAAGKGLFNFTAFAGKLAYRRARPNFMLYFPLPSSPAFFVHLGPGLFFAADLTLCSMSRSFRSPSFSPLRTKPGLLHATREH